LLSIKLVTSSVISWSLEIDGGMYTSQVIEFAVSHGH